MAKQVLVTETGWQGKPSVFTVSYRESLAALALEHQAGGTVQSPAEFSEQTGPGCKPHYFETDWSGVEMF